MLIVLWLTTSGGCHPADFRQATDLHVELSAVTSRDLLDMAASYARSGDLLRAEQYLSVARQRGHDESTVVYGLVRVCVAASRYRSALTHARTYLRDHPTDWSLRLVVAAIYEALGDVTRAESELERIVVAEPFMPLPHYRLAMLYGSRRSERARAREHLEKYLSLSPQGLHAAEARSILSQAQPYMDRGPSRVFSPGSVSAEESTP